MLPLGTNAKHGVMAAATGRQLLRSRDYAGGRTLRAHPSFTTSGSQWPCHVYSRRAYDETEGSHRFALARPRLYGSSRPRPPIARPPPISGHLPFGLSSVCLTTLSSVRQQPPAAGSQLACRPTIAGTRVPPHDQANALPSYLSADGRSAVHSALVHFNLTTASTARWPLSPQLAPQHTLGPATPHRTPGTHRPPPLPPLLLPPPPVALPRCQEGALTGSLHSPSPVSPYASRTPIASPSCSANAHTARTSPSAQASEHLPPTAASRTPPLAPSPDSLLPSGPSPSALLGPAAWLLSLASASSAATAPAIAQWRRSRERSSRSAAGSVPACNTNGASVDPE